MRSHRLRPIGLVLAVGLVGGAAVSALADPSLSVQSPGAAPPPPSAPLTVTKPAAVQPDARRAARRAERLDETLQAMRAGLQLTSSQAPLWPPVADALRGLDAARGIGFRRTLAAADSSIDALKLQGDHMARVGAAMGRLADATKPLVASLSPDQKSRLPSLIQGLRPAKIITRAFEVPNDGSGTWGPQGAVEPSTTVEPAPSPRSAVLPPADTAPAASGAKTPARPDADDDE